MNTHDIIDKLIPLVEEYDDFCDDYKEYIHILSKLYQTDKCFQSDRLRDALEFEIRMEYDICLKECNQ